MLNDFIWKKNAYTLILKNWPGSYFYGKGDFLCEIFCYHFIDYMRNQNFETELA